MTTNENREDRGPQTPSMGPSRGPSRLEVVLCVATGLALVACTFLALNAHTMSDNMAMMRESTRAQLAKISDQITQSADDANQRIESIDKSSRDSAVSTQDLARAEVRKTNAALSARIAAQTQAQEAAQKQISGQLDSKMMP